MTKKLDLKISTVTFYLVNFTYEGQSKPKTDTFKTLSSAKTKANWVLADGGQVHDITQVERPQIV